jgi:hypothetical protein
LFLPYKKCPHINVSTKVLMCSKNILRKNGLNTRDNANG